MDVKIELKPRRRDGMLFYRKISNMKEFRKNMKDDMELLLNLSMNLMKFKLVVCIIVLTGCQYLFTIYLNVYHLLSTFDKSSLLKYGSFVGIEIFVLMNICTILTKHRKMLWFIDNFKTLSLPIDRDVIGKKKYQRLMFNCMMIKFFALVNYGLGISAALGIFISPEFFNSRTYLSVWVRKNFENYAEYILLFFHMSHFPVAMMLISLGVAMTYCSVRAVLQFIMINKAVEGICETTIHPALRYDSRLYQAIVLQKLKICIMMHQLTTRAAILGGEIVYESIISISAGAVILGGSLLIEFFTYDFSEINNEYFAIVCFALAGCITTCLYVCPGQFLKDESEKTYRLLTNLPWYYMNKENKQLYSIFLRRAAIPVSVTNNLIEVNYILLARLVKAIYSTATVLSQFVRATSSNSL